MKCFSFKGSFVMAVLLLFFVAVMPAWSGDSLDQVDGGAIASLDSAVESVEISSLESHPVGVQVVDMKDSLFAGPPLLPAIVLAEKGKTLPSHRIGKGFITIAEYSRPPDLFGLPDGDGIKTGHSDTQHIGTGVFMKAIGVRQPRSGLVLI